MRLFKPLFRHLIVVCWLMLCGKAVEAQVAPPIYTFVEVTNESGKPVAGAAVVIYNASGEEVRHWVTDDAGKAYIRGSKHGLVAGEQWLYNNKDSYIIRITRSGYLTYENALEGSLADKLDLGDRSDRDEKFKLKIKLLRHAKSKVSEVRKTSLKDYADNRPP